MDALDALHTRVSIPRVAGPVPTETQLQAMFRAAMRAPDHGQLRPWRFLRIEGAGLEALADLFAAATKADAPEASEQDIATSRSKALRTPLVIVTLSKACEHPKIPPLEQNIAAGCATHAMLIAAHAQGIGAVWRTGPMASHPLVAEGLGLQPGEKILAMLYVGQPIGAARVPKEEAWEAYVQHWDGASKA